MATYNYGNSLKTVKKLIKKFGTEIEFESGTNLTETLGVFYETEQANINSTITQSEVQTVIVAGDVVEYEIGDYVTKLSNGRSYIVVDKNIIEPADMLIAVEYILAK